MNFSATPDPHVVSETALNEDRVQAPPPVTPRTFHLTIAYDGTRYSGWQIQPGKLTIQSELEKAAKVLLRRKKDRADEVAKAKAKLTADAFRILGSGRTDAGVHAWGQVGRCVMPDWSADAAALLRGINSRLPDDIVVTDARETVPSFHPIADAICKRYRYQLRVGGQRDPFATRTWYQSPYPLRLDWLQAAAAKLIGRHDFAAFQASGAERLNTVRTITHSEWTIQREDRSAVPATADLGGVKWCYEVQGDGFLYNMVRNLVGTMIEVGRGFQPLQWIDEVMDSRDRKRAGETAPAHGLFLCRVEYPEAVFLSDSLLPAIPPAFSSPTTNHADC